MMSNYLGQAMKTMTRGLSGKSPSVNQFYWFYLTTPKQYGARK